MTGDSARSTGLAYNKEAEVNDMEEKGSLGKLGASRQPAARIKCYGREMCRSKEFYHVPPTEKQQCWKKTEALQQATWLACSRVLLLKGLVIFCEILDALAGQDPKQALCER